MDVTEAQTEQGAPGKAQLCWVGCSPMTLPMCCPGPGWHKAGGGRSCVMVGGPFLTPLGCSSTDTRDSLLL